jgi:protein ImuB
MLCGPERIESGWWDDGLIERDYFIAENDARQLLWVYRERRATDVAAQWFLHGFFA